MPELPEVETTCRNLRRHIIGKRVVQVLVKQPKLRWPVPTELSADIQQSKILSITRRAKYILFATTHGTAIIHLGMSGSLYVTLSDTTHKKHDHIEFQLEDGTVIRYHDPRRFGALLWTRQDPLQHPVFSSMGVEPLEAKFNARYLFTKTRQKHTAIKLCLMDNRIVVGVGNIYANESLFKASISPTRLASSLTLDECQRIVKAVKSTLKIAILHGGTTLRDYLSPEGKIGYFVQQLAVYGREGEQCVQCKTILKMIRLNQRSTVFCSKCQM